MKLLVLGGTGFVGRTIVDDALTRGWQVTTINRGHVAEDRPGVEVLRGDRLAAGGLDALLGREWDAVVDTWSGAPRAVRDSTNLLVDSVGHYGYVSSRSVYQAPPLPDMTENAPLVAGSPDAEEAPYDQMKVGGELAVVRAFGDRGLLARAGLILGPYEDIGRLPWWLLRAARGGPMLAPGPADLPLQYIDARDLAAWMLDAAEQRRSGAYNTVSRRGHTTMRELLERVVEVTGGRAELRWIAPEVVLEAGVEPWNDLPIWIPPGHPYEFLHKGDVSKAHAAGLVCRPIAETVADTWTWLRGLDGGAPLRADRSKVGLDPEVEAGLLAG